MQISHHHFPDEILLTIFSQLDLKDICSSRRVCKTFNRLLHDEQFLRGKINLKVDIDSKYVVSCLKYNLCVILTFIVKNTKIDYYFRRDVSDLRHLNVLLGTPLHNIVCIAYESTCSDPLRIYMKKMNIFVFNKLLRDATLDKAAIFPYIIDQPIIKLGDIQKLRDEAASLLFIAKENHVDPLPSSPPGLSRIANLYEEFP